MHLLRDLENSPASTVEHSAPVFPTSPHSALCPSAQPLVDAGEQ